MSIEEVSQEDFREGLIMDAYAERDDARQEAEHHYMMNCDDDVDYRYDYIDRSTGIREALSVTKDLCKMYDLDFNEILDGLKDEL